MRASAEIIGSLIMIAIVVVLGIAFLSLFTSQMVQLTGERAKVSEINRARMSLDLVLLHSNVTEQELFFVLHVSNIGDEGFAAFLVAGGGKVTGRFPTLSSGASIYIMKEIDVLDMRECRWNSAVCEPVRTTVSPFQIFTEEELTLSQLGSRGMFPLAKLNLVPGGSKTICVALPRTADEVPLLLVLVSLNNKYYLVSHQVLSPAGK